MAARFVKPPVPGTRGLDALFLPSPRSPASALDPARKSLQERAMPLRLAFQGGTIRIEGLARGEVSSIPALPATVVWDEREGIHRLPAIDYADLVLALRGAGVEYADDA